MRVEGAIDVSAMLRPGVYVLLHRGAIVYIGQSKLMLTRVYSHRAAWGRKRTKAQPRGVIFDEVQVLPCRLEQMDELEAVLIAKYKPRYNTQYNNGLPPDLEVLISGLLPPQVAPTPIAPVARHRRY